MSKLNDLDLISKLDEKDMYHNIIHMPEMVLMAYELKISKVEVINECDRDIINRVVIMGNGTAVISAEIIKTAFNKNLAIDVVEGFDLPYINENTLVILVDYYGKDEELNAAIQAVKSISAKIALITSNKNMVENSINFPNLIIPDNLSSRSAIAYNVFSLIKFLEAYKLISSQAGVVVKTIANLINKAGAIAKVVPDSKNFAKSSAERLDGKIPVIYAGSPMLKPLAKRWKQQFNMSGKTPAYWNSIPELFENEIEAWTQQDLNSKFIPVILNDFTSESKYSTAIKNLKAFLTNNDIEYMDFFVEGETIIEKLFSLIYLGDMITYYLGILNEHNPGVSLFQDFLNGKKDN